MKKVLIPAALFLFPFIASAKGMMYSDGGSCGMGTGMLFTHILGVLVLAIWGVVGVLAAAWLWQHMDRKGISHHHAEK